jgi:hypothetical protein
LVNFVDKRIGWNHTVASKSPSPEPDMVKVTCRSELGAPKFTPFLGSANSLQEYC